MYYAHFFIFVSCLTLWFVKCVGPFTMFTSCYYDITTVLVYESYLTSLGSSLTCLTCEPMAYTYLSMVSPTCVCDKLCQYFSFLSMFMDLFYIVVKYLQCSLLNFSPFYLFISKFIIMFSVTCSTESVMLSCFNKILYLILNLEKKRVCFLIAVCVAFWDGEM